MYGGGGGGGQYPGQAQQQQGYMQPQQTGYMGMQQQRPMMTGMPPQQQQGGYLNPQATGMNMGMGMQPQMTGISGGNMNMGMGMGGLAGFRQPSYGQPGGMMGGQQIQQQRFLSPNPMQMQPTGMMQSTSPRPQMGMQPQATGYSSGPMQMQPTGLMPQQTGMMMPQMTGMPMDPRLQLMSMQFLPAAQPFSGAPNAHNMNFSSGHMQPSSFQSSIQNLSQQQQGSREPKIPWALSKEERKSYDSVFRAWDAKSSGFISGDVAREVFGQSGLDRDRLMQIWHLSDTENRGKLNLAEFHVAMGLIYRALNGNDLPEHLPPELVPPSARDLNESVDFLKDLLKRDTNVRNTTGLNLPEAGSNSNTAYGKSRSFHENPIQKQDAAAYKHTDETGSGYKSSSRHLDRKTVRYGGESAADDLSEMKRQLAQTQKMLDSQEEKDDEDREVEKEMDELRFRIKRVQDDIDYYNRRGGRDAAENRRKAERELLHLMHERLPLLEKRLEDKDRKQREKKSGESRDRDRRNEDFDARRRYRDDRSDYQFSSPSRDRPLDDDNGYNSRSRTPTVSSRSGGDRYDDRGRDRTPPPAPPPASEISKPAPAPPAPPAVAAIPAPAPSVSSAPPRNMSAEEKQAWLRSEAQRRIQERMRVLGATAPPSSQATSTSTTSSQDSSVEQRLAADRMEAEAKAAQADAEASAREEARRARLEEQRIQRERAAVTTIKSELKEQEKSEKPPPAFVLQVAKEEIDEQEEMLRRREEVLKKEKEERMARMRKLEEEEEEAKRQEEAFKQRQEMFQSKASSAALPAPVRKGKGGPPPPPPSRAKVPPPVSQPATTTSAPPVNTPVTGPLSPPAPPPPAADAASPNGGSSTNPFHRKQPNGAPVFSPPAVNASSTTPGGTNPFFRPQQDPSSSDLPAPQRSAATATATAAPAATIAATSARSTSKAPVDDDDWGEEHGHNEDDDDNDGPGSTTRATRQNLAQALFSGLVPTPPPSAPAMSPRTPQTPAPPIAPPAPAAPAAPPAPIAPPAAPSIAVATSGPADRGALLSQIAGGARLRKTQTNDRSAASVSGAVIGDPSPPVQEYIPPPSPPATSATLPEMEREDDTSIVGNSHRQSVDWAGQLASDHMNGGTKASVLPEEPSVREEAEEDSGDEDEGPEELSRSVLPIQNGSVEDKTSETDELDEFDLSKSIRVRTLYTYEAQREEDLSFVENSVILAHPAKEANSDWWYGTLVTGGNKSKGTFPRTYVQSVEQPKMAKALYDFAGSSAEEMNLTTDQELQIVDDEDEHWWKVIQDQERILIVPASYVELVSSATPSIFAKTSSVHAAHPDALSATTASKSIAVATPIDKADSQEMPLDDEEYALQQAIRNSERDARLENVARAREEKDYKRALELSAAREEVEVAGSDTSAAEADDDDDHDSNSTTGWTSSEDESEEEEETEEAKQFRAAERIRVLEAAGILILNDKSRKDLPVRAEDQMLRRKSMKKPKPERPDRKLPTKKKERPNRPDRPPPRLPPKEGKAPEEEMEDAYDRYMKMTRDVHIAIPSRVSMQVASATPLPPSSPSPPPAPSLSTTGGGLLNTIKSMSRRGAGSPAERKPTPTISGPMSVRKNSPAIGSPSQPNLAVGETDTSTPVMMDLGAASWSSVIGTRALSDIPEMERKRQEAIFELIKTEGTHVRDLQIIVEVFFNAMQDVTFLSEKARTVIFANVEDVLLAAVTLFSDLEIRQKESRLYVTRIGDILDNHMRQMKVYLPYCVNQSPARHILMSERSRNANLDKLLVDLRNGHPAARGLDLSSFLLVPMQRLTRYPLLISQILRFTDGETDPQEMKDLQSAMHSSQQLLDTTNEAIRARESYDRLQSISKTLSVDGQVTLDLTKSTRWMGPRSIIRDEVLQKQKSGRKVDVVLCTDLILLLSGNRLYRMPMPLEEIVIRDVPAGLTGGDDLSFQIVHQGREKTNLRCPSARICHAWMHSIDSARSECLAAANKAFR